MPFAVFARRRARQGREAREKPEAAGGTQRSEYRTGEDFRARAPGPCRADVAGQPFRAGERDSAKPRKPQAEPGRDHGLIVTTA